jgi:hypothetical protein
MKLVAFKPDGILAPAIVLYAMVPPGEVTIDIWLNGLASRVQMMLDRKKWFKKRAANKACELLNLPPCEDLNNFGRHIISDNSSFKEMILASITKGESPFPAIVKEQDEEAFEGIQVGSLEGWAGLASLVVSGILLSGSKRHNEYAINKQYFSSKNT